MSNNRIKSDLSLNLSCVSGPIVESMLLIAAAIAGVDPDNSGLSIDHRAGASSLVQREKVLMSPLDL